MNGLQINHSVHWCAFITFNYGCDIVKLMNPSDATEIFANAIDTDRQKISQLAFCQLDNRCMCVTFTRCAIPYLCQLDVTAQFVNIWFNFTLDVKFAWMSNWLINVWPIFIIEAKVNGRNCSKLLEMSVWKICEGLYCRSGNIALINKLAIDCIQFH